MKIGFLGNPEQYKGAYSEYRKWSLADSYGYTLLFEPFVLHKCRELPEMLSSSDVLDYVEYDLLVVADLKEDSGIEDFLCDKEACKAIVIMPTERMLRKRFGKDIVKYIEKVPSLKESWHMEGCSGRKYIYPSDIDFQIIEMNDTEALSSIGENPDFLIGRNTGIFATDFFRAIAAHINEPILPLLLNDCSLLLADGIIKIMGFEPALPKSMDERYNQLRRDFNSAGYAFMIMNELKTEQPSEKESLARYEEYIVSAADAFVSCEPDLCENCLKKAFMFLLDYRMKFIKKEVYYIDMIHAGGMFKDIGYFEFDWPEKTAESLNNLMEWVERRDLRLCIDFSAGSLEHFLLRYPSLKSRMSAAIKCGKLEVCNGTYGQPYPFLYSNESMLRQFEYGNRTIMELFGVDVKTYAAQEYGFSSSIPALLKLAGYNANVGRVYNQGSVPCINKKLILWQGKDGSAIKTLPSHTYMSEKEYDFTYLNLHIKLLEANSNDMDILVSTSFGDISYYRPFKEELARICYYAPVFGSFCTYEQYFRQFTKIEETYEIVTDDLQFDGYFLNLNLWGGVHGQHAGGNNWHHSITGAVEKLLLNMESVSVLLYVAAGVEPPVLENEWKRLLYYEGHDNYLVPYESVGEYMCDQGNLIHYCGPVKPLTIRERSEGDLECLLNIGKDVMNHCLEELGCFIFKQYILTGSYLVYNFSPARRKAVEVSQTGIFFNTDGSGIVTQKTENGMLLWLDLPAYGYKLVYTKPGEGNTVEVSMEKPSVSHDGKLYAQCQYYTLCVNTTTGIIEYILDKQTGRTMLVNLNRVAYKDSYMEAFDIRLLQDGPIRQSLIITGRIVYETKTAAEFTSTVELYTDSRVLYFKTVIEPVSTMHGEQWDNSIKIVFGFPSPVRHVYRNCSNVIEETSLEKYGSLYFTRIESENGSVNFYNYGNQLYRFHDKEIENILIFEREPMKTFEYAIELNAPWGIQEAIKVLSPCHVRRLEGQVQGGDGDAYQGYLYGREEDGGVFAPFSHNVENVIISSLKMKDGRVIVTYNEVSGANTVVSVSSAFEICEVYTCNLRGECIKNMHTDNGKSYSFSMEPWEIKMVSLKLMNKS